MAWNPKKAAEKAGGAVAAVAKAVTANPVKAAVNPTSLTQSAPAKAVGSAVKGIGGGIAAAAKEAVKQAKLNPIQQAQRTNELVNKVTQKGVTPITKPITDINKKATKLPPGASTLGKTLPKALMEQTKQSATLGGNIEKLTKQAAEGIKPGIVSDFDKRLDVLKGLGADISSGKIMEKLGGAGGGGGSSPNLGAGVGFGEGGKAVEGSAAGNLQAGAAKIDEMLKNRKATSFDKIGVQNVTAAQAEAPTLERTNAAVGGTIGEAQTAQAANIGGPAIINQAEQQQVRSQQQNLAAALQARAAGTAPSLAEAQLKAASDRAIAQQQAIAGSARGGNVAQAQRQAAINTARLQQEASQAAAQARIQEQTSAEQQLAGVLSGTRATDVDVAQTQAQLGQQANIRQAELQQQTALANQQAVNENKQKQAELIQAANLQNRALTSSENQALAKLQSEAEALNVQQANTVAMSNQKQKLEADLANQASQLKAQGMDDAAVANLLGLSQDAYKNLLASQTTLAAKQADVGIEEQKAKSQMLGSGISAIGAGIAAMSEPKQKKNIKLERDKFGKFLDALKSYSFEYKDTKLPGTAEGKRYGIMADQVEKSDVGKTLISKDASGNRMIDTKQGLLTALGAMAEMNKRLKKLEKEKK